MRIHMNTRAENMRTAVVVAAHRMYDTLGLCLSGVLASVTRPADLIFVDNGSGGALTDWVRRAFPDITVLTLEENQLFCGGYNAGIRLAIDRDYDSVLIANADTEVVNHGLLDVLNNALERHPRAAFAGPLVYLREPGNVQTTCLRFPSLLRNILVWLPYRLFPRLISRQPGVETEVDFLNGVCVLCRVAALREVGLMDETFGAYVEDTDWSWRARARRWSSVFVPLPCLIHHEELHGYEHHSFKSFLLKRNTVRWFIKAGKPWSARCYAVAAVALAWLRVASARTRNERSLFLDFARRLQIAYRGLLSERRLEPLPAAERSRPVKTGPERKGGSGAA
jgi:GT2 family glycosyltransferase